MSFDPALLDLLSAGNLGALATIKRDGRPQLSNINYEYDAEAARIRISVTDDRAKVRNMRRDARASLYVSSNDGWAYTVADGDVTLSDVATEPHDAAVEELVELYRNVRGEDHPDWEEYRAAMVADRRLVARLAITHVYGVPKR
jgi:PPOX class probable F420-dependent enzyme